MAAYRFWPTRLCAHDATSNSGRYPTGAGFPNRTLQFSHQHAGNETQMNLLSRAHTSWVHQRRVKVLATRFAGLFPAGTRRVLDVGCGDGLLAQEIKLLRKELEIEGLDVFARPGAAIPVTVFDGRRLPFEKGSFDVVMFSDVLHHAEHPRGLLREAARVARLGLAIKDHLQQGLFAHATLSVMDWIGNAAHGVAIR